MQFVISVAVAMLAFGLNVPLGMWRVTTRKFTVQWFVAIHLAVPLIYLIRSSSGIPAWMAPVLIAAAVLGQLAGGILKNARPQPHDKTM
ncbi:hypothetical protein [Dethiobacter alkaliphilus]|uniref:Uncharacterized protein n=1 Tax=Dethiobacter alkaliphilus AHT 1 TaxID=555088 RepID=C0GCY4_DETAL|nr:hypothetical protein [Dethiobacter alkaliphilus]EEG79069.1 conserved hypothetical protein [Dethiobacter alkaliphilus AHT 1]